jgi:hypothetical protein
MHFTDRASLSAKTPTSWLHLGAIAQEIVSRMFRYTRRKEAS